MTGAFRAWLPTSDPSSKRRPIDSSSCTNACIVCETAVCEESAARAPAAAHTMTPSTTGMYRSRLIRPYYGSRAKFGLRGSAARLAFPPATAPRPAAAVRRDLGESTGAAVDQRDLL